jgi:hypothetical protein
MVGFLSQNYVTPLNNLVNMIVLLEYFSHKHKYMYVEQTSCELSLRSYEHVTLGILNEL